MAKLIRINPDESREVIHNVTGIGISARIKHPQPAPVSEMPPRQEFYAVRLLKPGKRKDGRETEYYVEMDREEAVAVARDLARFLGR